MRLWEMCVHFLEMYVLFTVLRIAVYRCLQHTHVEDDVRTLRSRPSRKCKEKMHALRCIFSYNDKNARYLRILARPPTTPTPQTAGTALSWAEVARGAIAAAHATVAACAVA